MVTQDFIKSKAEYGYKWGQLVKGSEGAMPTIRQIIDGLANYYDHMTDLSTMGQSKDRVAAIKL